MDFLKTLLVYLSLTYATSVQGAPTPAPTEIPTATPEAVVETGAPASTTDFFTPETTDGKMCIRDSHWMVIIFSMICSSGEGFSFRARRSAWRR